MLRHEVVAVHVVKLAVALEGEHGVGIVVFFVYRGQGVQVLELLADFLGVFDVGADFAVDEEGDQLFAGDRVVIDGALDGVVADYVERFHADQ